MVGPADQGEFLRLLEERGELRRVAAKVDPDLEIAAVTDRVAKGEGGGKALLFENVLGHSFPVATNLFGSRRRIAWGLGAEDLEEAAARLSGSLRAQEGPSSLHLDRLLGRFPQQRRERPPCREAEEASLDRLPALRNWPGDGGRFLTLPLVFTRDPETGRSNCGMYRMQLFDGKTAGLHWSSGSGGWRHHALWSARGERMPVAVALGGPPALTYAAAAPLPEGAEETAFAGWLRGEPLETVQCEGGLEAPALAEFLLEGYVEPEEVRSEGPFGNHTGFYAPAAPAPVFHLLRLTRRRDPVLPCTVVGPPPTENLQFARATETLFLPLLQCDFPEIVALHFLAEGAFHGCALVAVRAGVSGRDLVRRLWEGSFLSGSRLLVAVDAGADLGDGSRILWSVINQTDPGRDLMVDRGRLGIDATEKEGRRRVIPDPAVLRKVAGRWKEYGID